MNNRPKLILVIKNTCSSIKRQINQNISQLKTRFTLNILLNDLLLFIFNSVILCAPYYTTSQKTIKNTLKKEFKSAFLVRRYSVVAAERTAELEEISEKKDFYQWLSGFTDAEGHFYIVTSKICAFRFQINLHKDDIDALYYIQKALGFGEIRSYKNFSSFTVTRLKDIALLLKIFDQYPLQGSKWLNYKDFSKAFELYINPDKNRLKEILKIKQGMNRSRSDYTNDKEIIISPYWLLGFIEGEGCFSINKRNNFRLDFSLSQSSSNQELLQKIKIYLENLPGTNGNYEGAIGISKVKFNNPNHQPSTRIETTRVPYITNIFIPFLENLTWHSKKRLDFQDWKAILMLKEKGHHLSEQGTKLIELILSQMNKNRLSTASSQPIIDRVFLLAEINKLISGPSNFGVRNGKKWIISLNKYYQSSRKNICVAIKDENGSNLHLFDSIADCANFLDVHPTTVSQRIKKDISFLFDNKQVFIKIDKMNNQ